jgi:hypothetical protein
LVAITEYCGLAKGLPVPPASAPGEKFVDAEMAVTFNAGATASAAGVATKRQAAALTMAASIRAVIFELSLLIAAHPCFLVE